MFEVTIILDKRNVPSDGVVTTQAQADAIPSSVGSDYEQINKAVVNVNKQIASVLLAKAYYSQLEQSIKERESIMEQGTFGPNLIQYLQDM